jgi:DNA-binding response OmpR family regulator
MKPAILLVEDDNGLRTALGELLEDSGYAVKQAENGKKALDLLEEQTFDVVVSDIRLGTIDGIQVMQATKKQPSPPVVILLTGYGSLDTAIEAVRAGAYDYMLKPTSSFDFLSRVADAVQQCQNQRRQQRVNAMIAQCAAEIHDVSGGVGVPEELFPEMNTTTAPTTTPSDETRLGVLSIDNSRHQAYLNGQPLSLTPIEFTLLSLLAKEPERVWRYPEIVRHTHNLYVNTTEARNLLRMHVHNLRHKIGPDCIVGVRGIGYILVPPELP